MVSSHYIDISWPLDEQSSSYKNNKPLSFTQLKDFAHDAVRDSTITLNSHTGTHIDAPAHFLANGSTVETIPLTSLVGTCVVLDLTSVSDGITKEDLLPHAALLTSQTIVLLKTRNSELPYNAPFTSMFIYLTQSGAEFLAQCQVATVGIDYLGIERGQPDHATHTVLMENGITIVEGLRLAALSQIRYHFICLPLAVQGLEAAPARAVVTPL